MPEGKAGNPTFAVQTMLRAQFLHQGFSFSDPAMAKAANDAPMFCVAALAAERGPPL